MSSVAPKLRIGCSGWSYQDWVGPFYPKDAKPGDYLHLYSSIFDAVEIDSTYYRTPSSVMVANWRKNTPQGFRRSLSYGRSSVHYSFRCRPRSTTRKTERPWNSSSAK
ncbi:DUF72 domain-containing protein [Candidatus Bathyarchaeota archaeon]|nr:MAG: DUF72 domain-containing protein [Candidatus Bathyarchaeota archaeon]